MSVLEFQVSQIPPPETASSFGNWLDQHPFLAQLIGLVGLVIIATLALILVRRLALPLLTRLIKRSRFTWDDAFLDARFFRQLSRLVPLLVMWSGVDLLVRHFHLDSTPHSVIKNIAAAALVLCGLLAAGALLNALHAIYARRPEATHRPVKGYVELAKIFLYVVGGLTAIAALLGKDVGAILAGIGAMTAVLLLIFKDTILSAVASVQLTNQDMVRIGDWIEMPSVGADGDVVDIALHTVKVQNWDKTVSTIPTYRLVSDTFKNWRGMQETGGRRIKRSLNIDLSTIRFLDKREVDKFGKIDVLTEYIAGKKEVLASSNQPRGKGSSGANLRRLTNVGTFRAYVIHYLRQHPRVHGGLTFLVRQLQPTEYGLPLEIYLFTDTTAWGDYEGIQADIFDHLLAVMPEFGLRVYQRPSGADLAQVWSESERVEIAVMSDEPKEPVLLETAHTPFEADVIIGVLSEAEIPAHRKGGLLLDEFAMSQQLMNTQGVEVYVAEDQLERARAVLAEAREAGKFLDEQAKDDADDGNAT